MELAVPNLSQAKREQLEKTKLWLLRLFNEEEAKKKQLDSLNARLLEAHSRRANYDREAEANEDSAAKLGAADVQISKLTPQAKSAAESLRSDLSTIVLQLLAVYREDIVETVAGPLFDQMHEHMIKVMEPFFPPNDLKFRAKQILQQLPVINQLQAYLQRPERLKVTNFDEAREAVNQVVKELQAIISGETLISIYRPLDRNAQILGGLV